MSYFAANACVIVAAKSVYLLGMRGGDIIRKSG